MNFTENKLKGSFIIETKPLGDNRGFFERIFCEKELKQIGFDKNIVQINRSFTKEKGTVRKNRFYKITRSGKKY